MGIVEKKNKLRSKFKLIRDNTSIEEKNNVTRNVEEYLKSFKLNKKFLKFIALYWPMQNEVDLTVLKHKYSLALPECQANKTLKFHIWDDSYLKNDLEGIPYPSNLYLLNHTEISVIFIPCLSIDRKFYRLGYGGGYFDRLRAKNGWNKVPAIGVLTSNCVSEELPTHSEFDIPLSGYITEKEIVV